jgi:hypothetical protein
MESSSKATRTPENGHRRVVAVFNKAEGERDRRATAVEAERAVLDARAVAENVRWKTLEERLEAAVRKAGG